MLDAIRWEGEWAGEYVRTEEQREWSWDGNSVTFLYRVRI